MQRAPHACERVVTMTTRSRCLICQRVRREFTALDAAELATRERSAMQALRAPDYFIVEAIATRFLSVRWCSCCAATRERLTRCEAKAVSMDNGGGSGVGAVRQVLTFAVQLALWQVPDLHS